MVDIITILLFILSSVWFYFIGNIMPYYLVYKKLKQESKLKNKDVWIQITQTIGIGMITLFLPISVENMFWIYYEIIGLNVITTVIAYWFSKNKINLIKYAYSISLVLTTIVSYILQFIVE